MRDPKLDDEGGRLAALHRLDVLDTPPDAPFDRITGIVRTVLGVPIVAVSLVDEKRQWFKSRQGLDACGTERGISFCAHAIRSYEPMLVPDALLDERFSENPLVLGPPRIRSYAGVPLRTPDGYNVGALCVIDTVPRTYEPSQVEILKGFASLVTDELELRRVAHSDHLTGAMSRRAFLSEMDRTAARSFRGGAPASLLMFDIDRFKAVNDTWGHSAGDEVLRAVAAAVMDTMRDGDLFGRIGGEEFAILLPYADAEGAAASAEMFRAAIEALRVGHVPPLAVTASFGISTISGNVTTSAAWMAAADLAVYAAKHGGRNRCVPAPTP